MANIGSLVAHLGVDTSGLRSAGQDFAKFEATTSRGLSNLTKGAVALAAAFGSLKLAQGGKDAIMFAASVEQADVALKSIANSMGMSAEKAIKYRDALRDVNITTMASTNATAQFIRMGLPIEKLNQLGVAAQGAAINYKMMTGETISSSEALDKMVHAIATGQSVILHNLGINTMLKDVLRENRMETGESSMAVDSHKRHLLLLNDVLEKTVPLMKLYGDSAGLATKNISSSKRPVEELKLALGNLFLPELTAASLAFYTTVSSGQKWVRAHAEEMRAATGVIKDFADGLVFSAKVLGTYAVAMGIATAATGGFAAGAGMFSGILATMRMQLSLTGATATVMATQVNAMGVSVAVAMQTATVGVLSLKAAFGVLSGVMIGWEIGKWWATFESGAKAGVAIVHALVKAWDYASEAAERFWIVAKGSATTWAGTMTALDAVGKKYEALAKTRSAAFSGSWDAAKGGAPSMAGANAAYKEDPAEVAKNKLRVAAEQAEREHQAAAAGMQKLADQWAKTKRGLEQELNLQGLDGLEKTLQEITNRAEELRATEKGADQAFLVSWESKAKAAAVYADELDKLSNLMDNMNSAQDEYTAAALSAMPKEQQAVAQLAEEYKKKQYAMQNAARYGLISQAEANAGAAALALNQQKENLAILNQQEEAAYEYDSALEKLGKTGTSVAEDLDGEFTGWARNMSSNLNDILWDSKATFGSILESFSKMITQMYIQTQILEPAIKSYKAAGGIAGIIDSFFGGGGTPAAFSQVSAYDSMVGTSTDFSMAGGGIIGEHVVGRGLSSGKSYEFGENGPEAVLNKSQIGGGANVQVIVNNNATGTQAQARESTDGGGNRIIEVFIEQVKGSIASDINLGDGAIPAAMGNTYGLNRVARAY